jgi:hypothetical protein
MNVDDLKAINEARDFWTALEHDDWKLASFTGEYRALFKRSGTDANGSPVPDETVLVTKSTMQFIARALHFMKEKARDSD